MIRISDIESTKITRQVPSTNKGSYLLQVAKSKYGFSVEQVDDLRLTGKFEGWRGIGFEMNQKIEGFNYLKELESAGFKELW